MKKHISQYIADYIAKQNKLLNIYREPLVGFADANSDYLNNLASITSQRYKKPSAFMPEAKTVISYFIPFTKNLNDDNKVEGIASYSWAKAYEDTNAMIVSLNEHIVNEIRSMGYHAMTPPDELLEFHRDTLDCGWSQRHIGYAAGLGTFGLNNMLITPKGCSGRLGSVISDIDVEFDQPMITEQCLYYASGICKLCVKNCVSKALSTEGFNADSCYEICAENAKVYTDLGRSYGPDIGSEVCGKCISFSPCAYRK